MQQPGSEVRAGEERMCANGKKRGEDTGCLAAEKGRLEIWNFVALR